MVSVILISTAAILVAIVGCAVIWRLDALRADEIEQTPPAPAAERQRQLQAGQQASRPASLPSQ